MIITDEMIAEQNRKLYAQIDDISAGIERLKTENAELVKALDAARFQLVTLGGDPRIAVVGGSDEIQAAVLAMIDAALKSAGAA